MEVQIITPQNNSTDPTDTPPEAPRPSVVVHKKSGKSKVIVYVLALLVIAGAAFAGAYFWQQSKNDTTAAELTSSEAKVSALQKQLADETKKADAASKATTTTTTPATTTSSTTDANLIPGAVDTARDDGTIHITPIFKYTKDLTAVWVEYGTAPDSLKLSTAKITKGLGEGTGEGYSTGFTAVVKESDVTPGTAYYYRVAATVGGQTKYSGVAGFTTSK